MTSWSFIFYIFSECVKYRPLVKMTHLTKLKSLYVKHSFYKWNKSQTSTNVMKANFVTLLPSNHSNLLRDGGEGQAAVGGRLGLGQGDLRAARVAAHRARHRAAVWQPQHAPAARGVQIFLYCIEIFPHPSSSWAAASSSFTVTWTESGLMRAPNTAHCRHSAAKMMLAPFQPRQCHCSTGIIV